MMETFLLSFIPLFIAFDVPGVLPIYIKFMHNVERGKRKRHLRYSLLTAFFLTLLFVIVGNQIMLYLGISMRDFFIAGGVILFIIAAKEIIVGHSEPVEDEEMFGVVPLGIPLLAGPAVITTSIIIRNNYGFFYFLLSLVLNLIICAIAFRFSEYILKFLGRRLIEALSKVFSLIIASIAVMFIRKGILGF